MKALFSLSLLVLTLSLNAQHKTKNIIVVTLDGMRWEEVFRGADEVLINDSTFTEDRKGLKEKFWANTAVEDPISSVYAK